MRVRTHMMQNSILYVVCDKWEGTHYAHTGYRKNLYVYTVRDKYEGT